MKKTVFTHTILLYFCLFLSNSIWAQNDSDELLIAFQEGTTQEEIDTILFSLDAVSIDVTPLSKIYLCKIQLGGGNNKFPNINEVTRNARKRRSSKIRSIGENFDTFLIPNSTDSGTASSNNGTCGKDLSINSIGNCNTVRVAVFDTGLGSNTFPANNWTLYDDNIGWDFVNNSANYSNDYNSHGSHIFSIIENNIKNAADLSNVKFDKNLPIAISVYKTHDKDGIGDIWGIIKATDQAVLDGVKIINMSFSYTAPPPFGGLQEPLQYAINIAGRHDVLVVAAAGNDSNNNDIIKEPNYPSAFRCDNIIAVASSKCNGQLSSFSNDGYVSVDISTFGESVLGLNQFGQKVYKSGTSQATAVVSATAALLSTHLSHPTFSDFKAVILNGAEKINPLRNRVATEGILAPLNALEILNKQGLTCGINLTQRFNINAPEDFIHLIPKLSARPNPFTEHIDISFTLPRQAEASLTIFNSFGQIIHQRTLPNHSDKIDIHWIAPKTLVKGVYFIQLKTKNKLLTKKIIKQ